MSPSGTCTIEKLQVYHPPPPGKGRPKKEGEELVVEGASVEGVAGPSGATVGADAVEAVREGVQTLDVEAKAP